MSVRHRRMAWGQTWPAWHPRPTRQRRRWRRVRLARATVERFLELAAVGSGVIARGAPDDEDGARTILLRVSRRPARDLADVEHERAGIVLQRDGHGGFRLVEAGVGRGLAVREVLGVQGLERRQQRLDLVLVVALDRLSLESPYPLVRPLRKREETVG